MNVNNKESHKFIISLINAKLKELENIFTSGQEADLERESFKLRN